MTTKVNARPPPSQDLIKAFTAFFHYKIRMKESMNNIQAQHALRTFRHLKRENVQEEGFGLSLDDIRRAARVVAMMPNDVKTTHNEFARELYEEATKRTRDTKEEGSHIDAKSYLLVLVQTGDSAEARELVKQLYGSTGDLAGQSPRARSGRRFWIMVMEGFARENNEEELLRTAEMAEKLGVLYGSLFHEIMTVFYAEKDNIEETKKWYTKPRPIDPAASAKTVATILRFCIRNNEGDWCKSVFRELLESNPTKEIWDIVFQWAAGVLGKGVEDVERMIEVMIRHNPDDETMRPDASTINGLVDLAMSLNDPYLAERYLALGTKFGIRPNAQTYILQMNYRVSAGDLTGAQAAYTSLQAEEILDNEDLPAINKYIRALCAAKSPNHYLITTLITDLDERGARLEAATVSALCMTNLARGELNDVVDLLQTHAFHYTLSERALIRDEFVAYCLDRKNTASKAWEAYTIFRTIFEETDIDIRTKMMNEFFQRRRSDMACHVFGHMRQHIRPSARPVLETYIQCFEGIASCSDRESLDIVHNMLKMDSSIEPNTRLYNSLMLAYTACDDSDKALHFWDDITLSKEGPTYNSLEIVFHACRRKPFGERRARAVWDKMQRMEIEVTPRVFVAYLGALAGNSQVKEAKDLVENAEKQFGFTPNVKMLGTFYNALPGQNQKDVVEKWARELYPTAWEELEKLGQITAKEGHRLFKMPQEEIKA
ncbi:hypothetical protein M430DRAFT_24053 [Amorphotheca resinae ATCC 22711]|uniref:Complex I intermediate-associated protein 84, mitochondrial n=1 Tax=Amorphotheca resinae ATCC 22711 TaxID=857342 RepID=A0A2T3BDZ1_AMORE|nr:hypothetical protein M430DRAFT_24053 [Amorphotheca resinae ATCC 22711]PSS27621.1 hypothetical protein M430DRAFT_24053 [Amorphotheca resinae ATCC 22711]